MNIKMNDLEKARAATKPARAQGLCGGVDEWAMCGVPGSYGRPAISRLIIRLWLTKFNQASQFRARLDIFTELDHLRVLPILLLVVLILGCCTRGKNLRVNLLNTIAKVKLTTKTDTKNKIDLEQWFLTLLDHNPKEIPKKI